MEDIVIRPVYDRRKKASPFQDAVIDIEIRFSRTERKWLSTSVRVYSNQWEDGVIVRRPDAGSLNRKIQEQIKKYREVIKKLRQEGIEPTKQAFTAVIEYKEKRFGNSFIDFAFSVMESRDLRPATVRAHKHTLLTLRESGIIRTFDDITPYNIQRFDTYLRKQDPTRGQTTLHNYHKRLKPYINEAVRMELIEDTPYRKWHDNKGKYKPKVALNETELEAFRALKLSDRGLQTAKDLFIFCCYTGLSYVDMQTFDYHKHTVTVRGMTYIDGERVKTGTRFYTPILAPAMQILEKYNYKLPSMTDQAYNRLLKCLGAMIGTNKSLSSHIARYTFATTVLMNHDVPIESIAKMLGHTRIQVTQLYAKILNTSIERQAERLSSIL